VEREAGPAVYRLAAVDSEGNDVKVLNLEVGSRYFVHRTGFSSVQHLSKFYERRKRGCTDADAEYEAVPSKFTKVHHCGRCAPPAQLLCRMGTAALSVRLHHQSPSQAC
jgi:hypothetical protein